MRADQWIGVDFDGVLVKYEGYQGVGVYGEAILPMVERVRAWLAEGKQVRIFTSRVGPIYPFSTKEEVRAIQSFCIKWFGRALTVTCIKDQNMFELWDDRAVQVVTNTGLSIQEWGCYRDS